LGETAHAGTRAGGSALPLLRRTGAFRQRLVVLMGARLALAFVSLGIALSLDAAVGDLEEAPRRGLYGTVALAFLATALYGVLLPRIQRPRRFAAINIATDIAVVSALVHFSGGPDSVFSFLYALVAVYGALLFERRGALVTAGLGMLTYGGVLLAAVLQGQAPGSGARSAAGLFSLWAVHAGAMALVAGLASFLAAELRRTGDALQQRTLALRRLADLHRRTVESLMSGLLTTDLDDRITSFNPEAERISAIPAAQALGRPLREVLPGVGPPAGAGGAGGTQARARLPYTSGRGEPLHLGVAAYVLRDEAGVPSGRVVIFQDVTEVVAMEAELRRSERLAAVGELSASIAHEIRNPLAAISGSIQMLRARAGSSPETAESARLMEIVLRETDRLNGLITDFLCYARPGPLALQRVELGGLAAELIEVLTPSLPAGVSPCVSIDSGLAVLADPARLKQVLWNLALNACQAMPDGGRLTLSARPAPPPQEPRSGRRNEPVEKDGWVEIEVRDEGQGIPAEVLDHIFDPFFTTKPGGTGLGLATVHRIVEEHGGSIRMESSFDRGTTVRIRLPRAEAA
jgi:two-component system sensor histidine kinase PilS (NtrC family)